ncbi:MAG TPA: hypothetical protein VFU34_08770, partial [Gaiellaceae bacterium]|nr:hypothetical protein [Gaiellaceae bacterium]
MAPTAEILDACFLHVVHDMERASDATLTWRAHAAHVPSPRRGLHDSERHALDDRAARAEDALV